MKPVSNEAEDPPRKEYGCPLKGGLACTERNCAWWNFHEKECRIITVMMLIEMYIEEERRP